MRLLSALLLWGLASVCAADPLADAIRGCAERFDAEQRADAARPVRRKIPGGTNAESDADVPLMSLGIDCPEALELLPHPAAPDLDLAYRRMMTLDWRTFAATLDGTAVAEGAALAERAALAEILEELDPAPLEGLENRTLWRERLRAWVLRQLRELLGPDSTLGRWLDELTPDDLEAFSNGVLAVILLLFCVLVAGVGILVYRMVSRRRGRRRASAHVELPAGLAEVPLLPEERIRALPLAQQPLALMRLVLARIDEDKLCSTRASMTNREVASALDAATGLRIDGLAGLADRCLFGGHEAQAEELEPCWSEVAGLGVRGT